LANHFLIIKSLAFLLLFSQPFLTTLVLPFFLTLLQTSFTSLIHQLGVIFLLLVKICLSLFEKFFHESILVCCHPN